MTTMLCFFLPPQACWMLHYFSEIDFPEDHLQFGLQHVYEFWKRITFEQLHIFILSISLSSPPLSSPPLYFSPSFPPSLSVSLSLSLLLSPSLSLPPSRYSLVSLRTVSYL